MLPPVLCQEQYADEVYRLAIATASPSAHPVEALTLPV